MNADTIFRRMWKIAIMFGVLGGIPILFCAKEYPSLIILPCFLGTLCAISPLWRDAGK